MVDCPSCGAENLETSKFCSECGSALKPEYAATATYRTAEEQLPGNGSSPSSDSYLHGRFLPGTKIAGRYRIASLVGKGGMGEVYRADDLKLGHTVALKFLPKDLADDQQRVEYFHSEVRLSRQISHPNICRVYDIGEVDGQHFLSMEFVDGEDLATLIRRIGRLPPDKGVDIARQLCAGLAAAHDKGVLHRDLKPANVMLDGRGRVRITDFGLARLTDEKGGEGVEAGTPAYMAPEQAAGREVSVQSDLYSLGLLLYEVFTGKPPSRLPDGSTPVTPSSVVSGIDPAVERAILRCLEEDPRKRPRSALAVAAALPGGDPLAAALAAGETPSPELVAAAGASGGLHLVVGSACLGALLVGLCAVAYLCDRATVLGRIRHQLKKPEVLEEEAVKILRDLGYPKGVDSAFGFEYEEDYLRKVDQDHSPTSWDDLETGPPAAMYFWYRESPRDLCPTERFASSVTLGDPAPVVSGMVSVRLDLKGRLLEFHSVPPPLEEGKVEAQETDWSKFFEFAKLHQENFKAGDHLRWSPALYADHSVAWEGHSAQGGICVEAASCRGIPVYFGVTWPEWTKPERMKPSFRRVPGSSQKSQAGRAVGDVVALIVLAAAALLARRNLRFGRSDRKGASRIALYVFSLGMLAWLFGASHVMHFGHELSALFPTLIWNVYAATWFFLVYVALEPYVRRLWPETLISWARLLPGHFRDPLVGRAFLVGALVGTSWAILYPVAVLTAHWFGAPMGLRRTMVPSTLLGGPYLAAEFLHEQQYAVVVGLNSLLTLLLLRYLFRNQWLAGSVFVVIWTAIVGLGSDSYVYWCTVAVFWGSAVFVLTHNGLLPLVVALGSFLLLRSFPITADHEVWYWGSSLLALVAVAALGVYGFYTSVAPRLRLPVRQA